MANNPALKIITGATIVRAKGRTTRETVMIEGEKISSISQEPPGSALLNQDNVEIISGEGCYLTPGLIDQHFHGGFGCDFNGSPIKDIHRLLEILPQYGITGVVPTIMTAPHTDMLTAGNTLEEVIHLNKPGQAKVLGIHLEGPFLHSKFRGAHPEKDLCGQLPPQAALEFFKSLVSPNLKLVTLAPELPAAEALIRFLTEKKIQVSAGHSGASYDELTAAANLGVRGVTHLFNAMRPFHHRDPGMMVAALNDDRLYTEIICDGTHVHPETIRMALRAKHPERITVISDCLAFTGLPEGSEITFGNQTVINKGGQAINSEGALAGSTQLISQCVKNLVDWNLLKFEDAIQLATANPARFLGLANRLGTIETGITADLVLWDQESLTVKATWIEGQLVHGKKALETTSF